jgi:predicted RNA-binding Zn-ribbon protein involved in translation (DUF1610 family)
VNLVGIIFERTSRQNTTIEKLSSLEEIKMTNIYTDFIVTIDEMKKLIKDKDANTYEVIDIDYIQSKAKIRVYPDFFGKFESAPARDTTKYQKSRSNKLGESIFQNIFGVLKYSFFFFFIPLGGYLGIDIAEKYFQETPVVGTIVILMGFTPLIIVIFYYIGWLAELLLSISLLLSSLVGFVFIFISGFPFWIPILGLVLSVTSFSFYSSRLSEKMEKNEKKFLTCPECSGTLTVVEEKGLQHGYGVKYRRCPKCGWKEDPEESSLFDLKYNGISKMI